MPPEKTGTYYAPLGGSIVNLAGGKQAAPGETVELTTKEVEDNKTTIESGKLLVMKKGGDD